MGVLRLNRYLRRTLFARSALHPRRKDMLDSRLNRHPAGPQRLVHATRLARSHAQRLVADLRLVRYILERSSCRGDLIPRRAAPIVAPIGKTLLEAAVRNKVARRIARHVHRVLRPKVDNAGGGSGGVESGGVESCRSA